MSLDSQLALVDAWVSPEQHGAVGDGVSNDLAALVAAASAAAVANKTLVVRGDYLLSGSTDIDIQSSADFRGSKLILTSYTGTITVKRKQTTTTHTSGSVVSGLMGSTDLAVNSSVFDGWDGLADVLDAYVIITTTRDFYSYREAVKQQTEMNRHTNNGVMLSPLKYPLTGLTVSSVWVAPMEERRVEVVGLTLDISGNSSIDQPLKVETSNAHVQARFIQQSAEFTTVNPTLVRVSNSCSVSVDLDFQWATRTTNSTGFTYCLSLSDSYDVTISAKGDGDGWGATGNNRCQKVTFKDSRLSRVDFHEPVREFLKLIDCEIGDWGVLVTMLGDLILDRCRAHQRTLINRNNSGLIRTRADTGGFCDGDLIIRDLTIIPDASSAVGVQLLEHDQNGSNAKPSGSPINYRFFRHIKIDGLDFRQFSASSRLDIQPANITSGDAAISVCESFSMRGARGNVYFVAALDGETPSSSEGHDFVANISDCQMTQIGFTSTTDNFQVLASIRDVWPFTGDTLRTEITAGGDYTLNGGKLSKLDFFSGAAISSPREVRLTWNGGYLKDDGDEAIINSANDQTDIRLVDCVIDATASGRFSGVVGALLVRPIFKVAGADQIYVYHGDPTGTGPYIYTIPSGTREGQPMIAEMGVTGTLARIPFKMPGVDDCTIVTGFHSDTLKVVLCIVHRVDAGTLFMEAQENTAIYPRGLRIEA